MHWSTIQLIGLRETRDLMRDRRTVFMVFLMPVALYPLLGVIGFLFALGAIEQKSTIGIYGLEHLPQPTRTGTALGAVPAAWFTMTPIGPGTPGTGVERLLAAGACARVVQAQLDYPPLVIDGRLDPRYLAFDGRGEAIRIVPLASAERTPLDAGAVDLMLIVPSNFGTRLEEGGLPSITVLVREGDENSRTADRRLRGILGRWKGQLKIVRFLRRGLPADFDDTLDIRRPQQRTEPFQQVADDLQDTMGRFFPFLLIMWALAGALHPAIDLTAGEKERGTLETLVLSPATRGEIVCGKFLAVWLFSAATALWNLAWLGGAAWLASQVLPIEILRFTALFWCCVLTVLLAAMFSAISMALGAYARSTKEGQYYLLPFFVVTMPLTFLPMVPGVELNWFYSLVPLTGATLLLQRLMLAQTGQVSWLYFFLVLVSLMVCSALALRWAVAQFHREEVLFKEAPGFDWRRWLNSLIHRFARASRAKR